MEFLKTILGEELYNQVASKLNEYNGNEANKEKQIKLANLAEGGYVDKNKYSSLEAEKASKIAELDEANKLIAELKKGTKGNEDLQNKITNHEATIKQLQDQLAKEKLSNAIKVNLLGAKATDIDYLTFQLNKQGELKLNDKGEIEGWNEKVDSLKTQFPNFFENSTHKEFKDGKLPDSETHDTLTKRDILNKPYAERVRMFEEDPQAFTDAMNK